jgi:hypothetical protein
MNCTQKNTENTHFLVESLQTTFYTHVLKVHFNIQLKFFLKKSAKQRPLKIILLAKKFYSNIKAKIMSYGINSSQIICKQWFDSA